MAPNGRYEPDGRQWLHDNLPKFVRNTGIGADRRVARFLKSGGPSAVMAEIARVDGSYVKRIYFGELFKQATLNAEQYRQAMAQASREIKSDYELASLLISIADRLPNDEQSRGAYFSAAGGIQSDYELRRVYSTMLKTRPGQLGRPRRHPRAFLDDRIRLRAFGAAPADLSRSSRSTIARGRRSSRRSSTIQSDYERHRILSSVVDRRSASDPATLGEALKHAAIDEQRLRDGIVPRRHPESTTASKGPRARRSLPSSTPSTRHTSGAGCCRPSSGSPM